MNFNERQFRQLADETKKTIVALGTTSGTVLQMHQKFTEQLIGYLKTSALPFERNLCLQWVDGMEHDPSTARSYSYANWIAFRRFVILLAEQEAGFFNSWKHYRSQKCQKVKTF